MDLYDIAFPIVLIKFVEILVDKGIKKIIKNEKKVIGYKILKNKKKQKYLENLVEKAKINSRKSN